MINLVLISFLIFGILLIVLFIYQFVNEIINAVKAHRREKKLLKEWNDFINQYKKYANSINDRYISICMLNDLSSVISRFDYDQVDEMQEYIDIRYQEHVPDIKRKIRNKKLEDIFKED